MDFRQHFQHPVRMPEDPATRHDATSPAELHHHRQTLARATESARRGRYDEAIRLLDGIPDLAPLAAKCLDLKARIFAQQGRFLDAQSAWFSALKRDPQNLELAKSLRDLQENANSRQPTRVTQWGIRAGLVVVAILVALWLIRATFGRFTGVERNFATTNEQISELRTALISLGQLTQQQLSELAQSIDRIDTSEGQSLAKLAQITTTTEGSSTTLQSIGQALADLQHGLTAMNQSRDQQMADRWRSLEERHADLVTTIDRQFENVDSLQQTVARGFADLETDGTGNDARLLAAIETLETDVAAFHARLEAQRTAATEYLDDIATRIESLAELQRQHGAGLAALSAKLESIQTEVTPPVNPDPGG